MTITSMTESIVYLPSPSTVMNRFYKKLYLEIAKELNIEINIDDSSYELGDIFSEEILEQIKKSVLKASNNCPVDDEMMQLLYEYEGEIADSVHNYMDLSVRKSIETSICEQLESEYIYSQS